MKQFKYHIIAFLCLILLHGMIPLPAQELPKDAQKYVAEYEKDVVKLQKALAADLSKVLAKTLKAADLEGANAIKAKIDELEKSTKESTDLLGNKESTSAVLGKWKYYFIPPRFSNLEFCPNGVITGGNATEHSWRLQGDSLEILTSDGSVGRRFIKRKNTWVISPDTNDVKFPNSNSYIERD
jgi:hypothetical protein